MRIVELIIDEKDEDSGISAVSVVESPAIESDFLALKKHEIELKEVDAEKRILMGAALIPNKQIYRKNDKSTNYGFNLPQGTWMISMKVNNDEIWNKVKLGEVKGFSIEGYFADKYEMSLINEDEILIDKIKQIITENENN